MHSGWGILVAVTGDTAAIEILDRRRVVVMDSGLPGAKQPYHFAAELPPAEAGEFIATSAAASGRLALAALRDIVDELCQRDYQVAGCGLILASGRALPPLAQILASHPLIHTAEGEFFRDAIRQACGRLDIPVAAIREKDLPERAGVQKQDTVYRLGKSLGPPWTTDHKAAALAAWMLLA